MNEFSKKALSVAKSIYKRYIIKEYEIVAVAVGGSVARGYGGEGSDVDLLFFCESITKYQKKFMYENGIAIEIHYIPCKVLYYHYNKISNLLLEAVSFTNQEITKDVLGEKKCELYHNNANSSIDEILSSWREIKKMTDTIILYEKNGFYRTFREKLLTSEVNEENIMSLVSSIVLQEQTIETVIKLFKLSSVFENKVFSKVFWIDSFLLDKQEAKVVLEKILGPISTIPIKWLNRAKEILLQASELHKDVVCTTCEGNIRRCNLGRCFYDYLNDTERAIKEDYIFGSWLSLKRAIDYARKLSLITGVPVKMDKDFDGYWEDKKNVDIELLNELVRCLFKKKNE